MQLGPKKQENCDAILALYLEFDRQGLRGKVKEAVRTPVDVISKNNAQDAWTRKYLQELPINKHSRIQHEIYRGIVFPALRVRFELGEPEAHYLLGLYWNNFVSSSEFTDQIGHFSREEFYERAYLVKPEEERYRTRYLDAIMDRLEFVFHEWPSGVLIDHENWSGELSVLRNDIDLASVLDIGRIHARRLKEFTSMATAYRRRLAND